MRSTVSRSQTFFKRAIANPITCSRDDGQTLVAYGIFSAGYGLSWFLGSALMGILDARGC